MLATRKSTSHRTSSPWLLGSPLSFAIIVPQAVAHSFGLASLPAQASNSASLFSAACVAPVAALCRHTCATPARSVTLPSFI